MSKRLPLRTHDEGRRALARIVRAFYDDDLAEDKYRALVYGFNTLLSYYKLSEDLRLEQRLDAIEDSLKNMGRLK